MRLHLDTDIGGDIDDLCALAMLLGWPGVEITGITTSAEEGGRRAGYVRRALELAGRGDLPVASGVEVASGRFRYAPGYPLDEGYWGGPVEPSPGRPERATEMLRRSIELGAVVVAVGPYTNLAELEARHPGSLTSARLVVMGGYVFPPREGFPPWGVEMDYNVQLDTAAAETVLARGSPTLVPLSVTVETALRRAYLPTLRRAGALGTLLASQAEAQARDERNEKRWGRTCSGLPDDTMAFLHDALACAIALGWDQGVRIDALPLAWGMRDGLLQEWVEPGGRLTNVVTAVDGPAFGDAWLRAVRRLQAQVQPGGASSAADDECLSPDGFPLGVNFVRFERRLTGSAGRQSLSESGRGIAAHNGRGGTVGWVTDWPGNTAQMDTGRRSAAISSLRRTFRKRPCRPAAAAGVHGKSLLAYRAILE